MRFRLDGRSLIERLLLDGEARARFFAGLSPEEALVRLAKWSSWCRAGQQPPPGDWRVWLVMAGRGYGKTRVGAEWVRQLCEEATRPIRVALVAATAHDARAVMVEGASGLLAIAGRGMRPEWMPSMGRLRWPNGAEAYCYSAAEPESLRGPQHDHAWADEIAKWKEGVRAWDNLQLGLRAGRRPRTVATTTPLPVPLIRNLLAEGSTGRVVVTGGRTDENVGNLATDFVEDVTRLYGGTKLGRQELDGELIEDMGGALWQRDDIERTRVRERPAELHRVVVGVDPPAGVNGDGCGIVVVGLDEQQHAHVLEDASVAGCAPEAWARAVAQAVARHGAQRVVAEANNGGAMVESVLHAADPNLPVVLVHATQGKAARAEPVAMLYAKGKVHHVGAMRALEDEMCGLRVGGGYQGPGRSPDRADALVWALSDLMLKRRRPEPAVRFLGERTLP